MEQPNRNYTDGTYRYGFQGQEKDDELKGKGNSIDFGARMYDSRIGRFFSKDPKENQYPQQSTYVYASNSVVAIIDKNGEGPVFPSKTGANAIVKDLNNIFKDKYNITYNAFSVKKTIIKVPKKIRIKQPWYRPDTYETRYVEEEVYVIETNEKFDWQNADKDAEVNYASLIYDLINMKHQIRTHHGDKALSYGYKIRDGFGGGKTYSNSEIIVSSKNKSYGERGTKGTSKVKLINGKRIGYNKGGVALHEWLYHVLGVTKGGANHMRKYYNIRTGVEHDNSIAPYKIPRDEQKELDKKKEKTKDG